MAWTIDFSPPTEGCKRLEPKGVNTQNSPGCSREYPPCKYLLPLSHPRTMGPKMSEMADSIHGHDHGRVQGKMDGVVRPMHDGGWGLLAHRTQFIRGESDIRRQRRDKKLQLHLPLETCADCRAAFLRFHDCRMRRISAGCNARPVSATAYICRNEDRSRGRSLAWMAYCCTRTHQAALRDSAMRVHVAEVTRRDGLHPTHVKC